MKKISVIYYSFTGNTMRMAEALEKGLKEGNSNYKISKITEMDKEDFFSSNILVMGSPANGTEEINKDYFQPFMAENLEKFKDKKVLLFGSYGWGGGKYLQSWKEDLEKVGAISIAEPISSNGSPNAEIKAELQKMGENLNNF